VLPVRVEIAGPDDQPGRIAVSVGDRELAGTPPLKLEMTAITPPAVEFFQRQIALEGRAAEQG